MTDLGLRVLVMISEKQQGHEALSAPTPDTPYDGIYHACKNGYC